MRYHPLKSWRHALPAVLALLALGRDAGALEKSDLTGHFRGFFSQDASLAEDKRVVMELDLWLVKDEVEGIMTLDFMLLDILKVSVEGEGFTVETESILVRGKPIRYTCRLEKPDGKPAVIKGEYVGRNGATTGWLELSRVTPKSRGAVDDRLLSATYKGKVTNGNLKTTPEGIDLSLTLNLEGDEVGGSVLLQGVIAETARPLREQWKLDEIRRSHDRLLVEWTDAAGLKGRLLGTVTQDGVNAICNAHSFGGGEVVIRRNQP